MALSTPNNLTNLTKNHYFASITRTVRFVMIAALFFFSLNLTSCTPTDTIAPADAYSAARENANIINKDDFEGQKVAKFWSKEIYTPTGGQLIADLHRAGKQAMRFSWKPSQTDGTSRMLRSELATQAIQPGETPERWYGYSSYMPSTSMANDNKTAIVSQWHGVPDDNTSHTVPPLAISIEPGNRVQVMYFASSKPIVKVMQHPTTKTTLDVGPAAFDRWVDYVVHIKWDATGKTGLLEIWQDGQQIVNKQNISIGYPEMRQPYWKMGLYCWTAQSVYTEKNIYYDEARIGGPSANYDTVKPGQSEGSARARQ